MIVPTLKAYRIKRPKFNVTELRMDVRVSFVEDDRRLVPNEFMAHVMADKIREYVNTAITDEMIEDIIINNAPTVCPCCGREIEVQ